MRQHIANQTDFPLEREVQVLINDSRDVLPVCGAGIGLIGGTLAPALGAVLAVAAWVTGDSLYGPLLHKLSTVLFYWAIPLLIFGGHCLDVLEKRGWKFGN
jgi:hypothetical protein